MSAQVAIVLLITFWVCIHGIYRLLHRHKHVPLPSFVTIGRRPLTRNSLGADVKLTSFHLRLSTSKLNARHDQFASYLLQRENQNIKSLLQSLYGFGVLLGVLGMVTAVICLLWMATSSVWYLLEILNLRVKTREQDSSIYARDLSSTLESSTIRRSFATLTPIIPGVTVPLSHLPSIVIAVFISQLVHELGHAIAGALESLSILLCGASLTVCIPAAFVNFPTAAMNSLSPKARARVIAAGPFHNIIFAVVVLISARFVNVASLVSGYKNVSEIGRVVVDVDPSSPLYLHLRPGSIITKIDDTQLSSYTSDVWTEYLTLPHRPSDTGWCVETSAFKSPDLCCKPRQQNASPMACFMMKEEHSSLGCIDPIPLLANPVPQARCLVESDCKSKTTCIAQHVSTQILRLNVRPVNGAAEDETMVLWSGLPEEVYEEVLVTSWQPRVSFLPLGLPLLIQTFWQYLKMTTISLFFFNLLPLPYLDGTELLKAFIDLTISSETDALSYDIEALERSLEMEDSRPARRWKERIVRIMNVGLCICLIVYLSVAIIDGLH
ncbi:peptidase family M50-domain-containing protein [Crepidotus variabilis]|uniref:Endopeptidase S2P n=1 Tax=Crepidotus variabilis TaxID=179855 RepID=A0A9P6E9H1_9AGAR|nr:peptidase family M50-domain-containing protein [Crepidotus variabilis]